MLRRSRNEVDDVAGLIHAREPDIHRLAKHRVVEGARPHPAEGGHLSDLFTGLPHFSFDYVFLEKMPIMGPMAKEFREHHNFPDLD